MFFKPFLSKTPLLLNARKFIAPSLFSPACFSSAKPSPHQVFKSPELDPESTAYSIMRQIGLQKHLNNVYKTTVLSFGGAMSVSYLAISAGLAPGLCFVGGGLGGLISVIAFGFTKFESRMFKDKKGNEYLSSVNSFWRKAWYGTFVTCSGLMMAPILGKFFLINPLIIPTALAVTSTICSGAALYAYLKPKGSLLWLGGPLTGCLISLLVMQLAWTQEFFL